MCADAWAQHKSLAEGVVGLRAALPEKQTFGGICMKCRHSLRIMSDLHTKHSRRGNWCCWRSAALAENLCIRIEPC